LKEAVMSDLDLTKNTNFSQNQNTGSSQKLKDQVADAGADVKQRADDALRASTDAAREQFKEAADAAKDVASGTADQMQEQARQHQRTGADFVGRFAGNIREAARAFESDAPFAARGINSAAEYVEDAAEKIRNGSFRDLVEGATDFAKRQPAAFLGISVLTGFAAVRFLKASGGQTSPSQRRNSGNTSSSERGDTLSGTSAAAGGEAWKQGSSRPGSSWERTSSSQRGNVS
jgi:gas vesicle protein